MKRGKSLEVEIKEIADKFMESINKEKEIFVVSHFDTDGITSAVIMIQTLKKLDKKFSLKIIKNLEEELIRNLPKNKVIVFLDLGSGSLKDIEKHKLNKVFIIDHHEIPSETQKIPYNIEIINPEIHDKEKISSSCLTYLFCKNLSPEIRQSAKLAILGMIGDTLEDNISKLNNSILKDSDIRKKRGLLIYPSTRPLNKVLEFSSNPFIPEVTGNSKGVSNLLREVGLNYENGKYKTLLELNKEEMSKLVTAILLRNPKSKNEKVVGDIFLIKFFNKLEDARELSAMINACSRLGESHVAIQFCMENLRIKSKVEEIHARYKQFIISGLSFASKTEKITGKGFVIINAKNNIKDTMIGTIASILSKSPLYEEGTIITAMAISEDKKKIKVSARSVGNNGRNIREVLSRVIKITGGQVGGHEFAAGCIISQNKEQEFIDNLKKTFEVEIVKV